MSVECESEEAHDKVTNIDFRSKNDWYWSNNHPPQGCYSYYGDKSYAIPEGDFTIEWEVRRPSGTTIGIDTFTVTENDTTTYLIEY